MRKIILHACCAPCASYPIKKLIEDSYEPVVFFYNPNIYPEREYIIRRDELKQYCKSLGIEFYEGEYNTEAFKKATYGLEKEPEKGARCEKCFKLRLNETALFAKNKNIDCFTTTLTVSPHKNSAQIFTVAKEIELKMGVEFMAYDFKKHDGFKISRQIAKENNMYAQNYCGCEYSIRA